MLIGEGHFGGDGRQPQVTLRMHVRHAPLFDWIQRTFPGGKLYGPYNHDGRQYLQWMARGHYLREVLVPLLDERLTPHLDAKSAERYLEMKTQYRRRLESLGASSTTQPGAGASEDGPATVARGLVQRDVKDKSKAADVFDRIRREQLEQA